MGSANNAMAAIGLGSPKSPPKDSDRFVAACGRCGRAVAVTRIASLADEFSLVCPACGHRGIFQKHQFSRTSPAFAGATT
jgi:DNA-directed RNA polymerase subunit RPC12/RpoP